MMNKLYNGDCLEIMDQLINEGVKVELIVTDPPYLIQSTKAGGNSKLAKSIQNMNDELENASNLTNGITDEVLSKFIKLQENKNCYIWCNHKQIPQYLDFFVKKHNCSFDILIWKKTNASPLFNNKYLTDKEYCLYFRKNGYCNPKDYHSAHTVFVQPMNVKDKKKWGHPTIKPLNIITNIIENSSKINQTVFDPFMGSGTTGVACKLKNRNFIGIELEQNYYKIATERIENEGNQLSLF